MSGLKFFPAGSAPEFPTDECCLIAELVNDPRDGSMSVARARVLPGTTTELHSLACREIYIILSGHGRMEDGEGGFAVGPGDCIDIPAGYPQRIANVGDGDLVFLCVCTPRFTPEFYTPLERA